ncbi:BA14K family protein [Agrobacterium rubi]|nr:BA14K family protein [Agrobacterium rubi]NTF24186.1 BA14K family protein [Agrobacterium rubi]
MFGKLAIAIIMAATFVTPAMSQDYRGHQRHFEDRRGEWQERSRDERMFDGIVGLTTGMLIGTEVARPHRDDPRFSSPPPRYHGPRHFDDRPRYDRPRFDYGRRFQAWSPSWYRWCSENYRTFNPRSGFILGRDGRREFCVVR